MGSFFFVLMTKIFKSCQAFYVNDDDSSNEHAVLTSFNFYGWRSLEPRLILKFTRHRRVYMLLMGALFVVYGRPDEMA